MTRCLVIANDVIENIIVADEGHQIPGRLVMPYEGAAEIGWAWQEGRPIKPEMDLSLAKIRKNLLVSRRRDHLIEQGMTFAGLRYQTRSTDRDNIAGASVAALGAMTSGAQTEDYRWHGGASDFVWIAEDNSAVPMDAQTMFAFGRAAMAQKSALIFHARALKDAVAAAATKEALAAIDINSGWPAS